MKDLPQEEYLLAPRKEAIKTYKLNCHYCDIELDRVNKHIKQASCIICKAERQKARLKAKKLCQ